MIKNGSEVANGTVLCAQVCVIGSGPAGITAAWELQKAGIKVILIEGSRPYANFQNSWPDKALLYNGETVGPLAGIEPDFLIASTDAFQTFPRERERVFGGTSTHWGGQSRPEDPIDLEDRPGFPGWPMTREELDPFYARASRLCMFHGDYGRHGDNFSNEYWSTVLQAPVPAVDGFDTEMYQYLGPQYLNFATRTFEDGQTIAESAVEVILNASLLEIDHQQGRVSSLRVASMDGAMNPGKATEFVIQADAYVLACGAVANARQLLLSNAGNEHDLVGRNFMGHPLLNGVFTMNRDYLTADQARFMTGTSPSGHWHDQTTHVRVSARFIPNADTVRAHGIGRCWFAYNYGLWYFSQAPNPDSRITLSDSVDPVFGQRQTRCDWQLSSLDETTFQTATQLFANAVTALGGQVLVNLPWEVVKSNLVINGHHMGTTRMAKDPAHGVVDQNLRVHSLDNLYVAGSSVFPSAGVSNPTFTIIALSIRLADHLKGVLGR